MFGTAKIAKTAWPMIAASFGLIAAIATAGPTAHAQAARAHSRPRQTAAYAAGEIIVKLKGQGRTTRSNAFIGKAVAEKSMRLKGSWSGLNMHHFALKAGQPVEDAINELQADPDVEYAEPNYIVTRQSSGQEGSAMSYEEMIAATSQAAQNQASSSGGVQAMAGPPSSGTYTQSYAPIQVPQAWAAMTSPQASPIVAVIDTGLDLNDAVFVNSGAIWTNAAESAGAAGVDDDGNGYVDDLHGWNFAYRTNSPQDDDGHGTHVAGIILGMTQDIRKSPIAAAKIRLMPLKFLDSHGSGTTSDAVQAIYYAANNGARIMNNSWGGEGFSNALLEAVSYAYAKHCLFVAAAGNASTNNDASPTYPANYNVPGLIAVAATDDSDALAYFSNYGAQTVNLGAPGDSILSTLPNNTWGYESGTSMATPMVSGIAALMMREQPNMWGYQARSLIFGGNQTLSSLVGRTTTQGRVNAYNSIVAAKSTTASASQPAYDASMYARSTASQASESMVAGCGRISSQMLDRGGDEEGAGGGSTGLLVIVLLAPIALSLGLRGRAAAGGRNQRRHDRFQIASQVSLRLGDRELSGSVSSISLGGAQINADALLESGGIVTMRIASPDGKEVVEVQGKVVWSEENKRYGVAFSEANDGVRSAIARWTSGLVPER